MLSTVVKLAGMTLAGGAIALAVISHGQAPNRYQEAASAASPAATPAMTTAPQPPRSLPSGAPSFPPAASAPQPVSFVASLQHPGDKLPCNVPGEYGGQIWATPGDGWPTTLKELYQQSSLVAVVTAVDQRTYWQRVAGQPSDPPARMAFRAKTTTDFRIDRLVKGSTDGWTQITEEGAPPASLPTCANLGYEIVNSPVARGGQQYVLFLQQGTDGLYEIFGGYDRFPVLDGTVHALSDVFPQADAIKITPQPLDQFLGSLSG